MQRFLMLEMNQIQKIKRHMSCSEGNLERFQAKLAISKINLLIFQLKFLAYQSDNQGKGYPYDPLKFILDIPEQQTKVNALIYNVRKLKRYTHLLSKFLDQESALNRNNSTVFSQKSKQLIDASDESSNEEEGKATQERDQNGSELPQLARERSDTTELVFAAAKKYQVNKCYLANEPKVLNAINPHRKWKIQVYGQKGCLYDEGNLLIIDIHKGLILQNVYLSSILQGIKSQKKTNLQKQDIKIQQILLPRLSNQRNFALNQQLPFPSSVLASGHSNSAQFIARIDLRIKNGKSKMVCLDPTVKISSLQFGPFDNGPLSVAFQDGQIACFDAIELNTLHNFQINQSQVKLCIEPAKGGTGPQIPIQGCPGLLTVRINKQIQPRSFNLGKNGLMFPPLGLALRSMSLQQRFLPAQRQPDIDQLYLGIFFQLLEMSEKCLALNQRLRHQFLRSQRCYQIIAISGNKMIGLTPIPREIDYIYLDVGERKFCTLEVKRKD